MKSPILRFFTIAALLFGMSAACTGNKVQQPERPCHQNGLAGSEQMHALINRLRKQNGQSELLLDSVLIAMAARYAQELAERGEVSHMDQSGRGPMERLAYHGQVRTQVAENLARIPDQKHYPIVIARDWWQQPREKANLLSTHYYRMGSGYYARDGQCYAVTLFTN